nr:hypothetical protein [Tanacetum cinerariifolium]
MQDSGVVVVLYGNSPPPCVDHLVPEVAASKPDILTGIPSLTLVDQDAPSVIPHGAKEADHDIGVAHMDNNPYFGILIPEPSSKESSSQVVIPNNVHSVNQLPEHISKWTKDHLIDNVIGDPARPSYKEAMTESCWIKAMQEELKEFGCLEVWELVPHLDHVMIITLKCVTTGNFWNFK